MSSTRGSTRVHIPSSSLPPSYPCSKNDPGDAIREPGDWDNNGDQRDGDRAGGHAWKDTSCINRKSSRKLYSKR